jgi:hypothetical protein
MKSSKNGHPLEFCERAFASKSLTEHPGLITAINVATRPKVDNQIRAEVTNKTIQITLDQTSIDEIKKTITDTMDREVQKK